MSVYSENMFESELAEYYDRMRSFRDYGKEARFANDVIRKYRPDAERVLDICCGTGEHALQMSGLGCKVTGVDMSDDMLGIARKKAEKAGADIEFRCGDVYALDVQDRFPAAYCLGYTFLYMTTHDCVRRFFESVNRVLVPGGVFILDFINGWSLLDEFPRDKGTYRFDDATIFSFEQATLNRKARTKRIEFQYIIDRHDGQVKTVAAEENLRIFFEDEVKLLMESCGFESVESYGDHRFEIDGKDIPDIVLVSGVKKG